jgi:hypothetical protein
MHPLLAILFIGFLIVSIKPLSTAYAGTQLSFEVSGIEKLRMEGSTLKANLMLNIKNPTSQPLNINNLNLKIFTPDKKELVHVNTQNVNLKIKAKKETVVAVPFKVNYNVAMADFIFPGIKSFFKNGFDSNAFMKELPNTMRVAGKVNIENLPEIPVDIMVDVKKLTA